MFSINGNNLPCVTSYIDAQQVYNRSDASSKLNDNERCLVSKRDTDKLVIKRGDSYSFRYHRTDLVTWHSADRLTIVPWDSISSRIFINRFTPGRTYITTHQGDQAFHLDHDTGFKVSQSFDLIKVGDSWQIEDAEKVCDRQVKYVVDSKLARTARQKVKDYMAWCSIARKGRPTYEPNVFEARDAAALLLSGSTDYSRVWEKANKHPKLVQAAVVQAGAVTEVPVPFGKLVSRSVYAPFV